MSTATYSASVLPSSVTVTMQTGGTMYEPASLAETVYVPPFSNDRETFPSASVIISETSTPSTVIIAPEKGEFPE